MLNLIVVEGHLGHTPELRYTAEKLAMCSNTLAVNHWRGRDKERETTWWDLLAFGKTAERLAEIPKGTHVVVEGNPEVVQKEGRDGKPKKYAKIIVRMIHSQPRDAQDAPQGTETPDDGGNIPF